MDQRSSLWDKTFKNSDGQYALAAAPNVPLIIAVLASIASRFSQSFAQGTAQFVALGMWFTWSWLEISSGVNYFRRFLGLVVLAGLLYANLNNGRF
jgi:hypothetical protein